MQSCLEIAGHLRFPDHHSYPAESLTRLADAFRTSGATALLVTSKDRVKLRGRLGEAIPLAELPLTAEPEAEFWEWLSQRLPLVP